MGLPRPDASLSPLLSAALVAFLGSTGPGANNSIIAHNKQIRIAGKSWKPFNSSFNN